MQLQFVNNATIERIL